MVDSRNKPAPDPASRPLERLRDWLRDRLATATAGRRVAVGFSGGRDSLALLDALDRLRGELTIQVGAIHVHHGLSANADAWAVFAETFCQRRGIPFTLHRVAVTDRGGEGVEAAARRARYEAFAQSPADLLLLAHHRDDQAETLLFNLLRGSGVHGAAAMRDWRRLPRPQGGPLAVGRPWLTVSRAEIDAYVEARGLTHVDDESNRSEQPSRNFLRHRVIPVLRERHPGANDALAAAARRFGEAARLLDELADQDLATAADGETLAWAALAPLSDARCGNALRRWLERGGVPLGSEAALAEFLRQCRDAASDRVVAMTFGPLRLCRWRGRLFRAEILSAATVAPRVWHDAAPVAWAGGELSAVPVMGHGVRRSEWGGHREVRPRAGGESLRLHPNGPARPLRLLFQEAGVPPWLRERWPLLWIDGALAAAPGLGVEAAFRAGDGEAGMAIGWTAGACRAGGG